MVLNSNINPVQSTSTVYFLRHCGFIVPSSGLSVLSVCLFFLFVWLNRNYLDQVAEDINDFLQESGQISIAELSKKFTFPTDFLLEVSYVP